MSRKIYKKNTVQIYSTKWLKCSKNKGKMGERGDNARNPYITGLLGH
jgi:hypothetical protein